MKVLALEISSAVGSVALLADGDVVSRADLPVSGGRTTKLFDVLEHVREQAGWGWDAIDLFAAGRGPGRYSGMRIALTAVQGLAAPGRRPVRAISSGTALAYALAEAHPDRNEFVILGDARRDRVWCSRFSRGPTGVLEQDEDWRLAERDEFKALLRASDLVVSSEWSRLRPVLEFAGLLQVGTWIERDMFPAAEWVGRLALDLHRSGAEGEPLLPIYLHPAVCR